MLRFAEAELAFQEALEAVEHSEQSLDKKSQVRSDLEMLKSEAATSKDNSNGLSQSGKLIKEFDPKRNNRKKWMASRFVRAICV
jgi:hypothetical protein